MSNFDRAVKTLNYVDEVIDRVAGNEVYATALEAAGLLMPDVPEIKNPGFWVDGLEINTADKDGEVLIEWEDESDYAYYGTQTRNLWLNRDQVLAILAAAGYAEKEQDNG